MNASATDQPADDRPRLVVQATDHPDPKRARRTRKNLHEPCTDQLALFDPENQS